MASFLNKLRMDNIFPALPFDKRREDEEEFSFRIKPSEFDPSRIQSNAPILGQSNRMNPQMNQGMNPELSKPMDVVYNPPESDKIGMKILGYDNDINSYRKAVLADKDADRELRAKQIEQSNQNTNRRLSIQEKQALTNEIKNSKTLPEAEKIKMMADVESGHITQRGQITSGQIQERGDIESRQIVERGNQDRVTEGVRQTGRETIEQARARHASELAELNNQADKDLATHKGTIDSSTSQLPSQQRTARLMRAEKAKANPNWSSYIKTIPGGGFTVTTPGRVFGPSKEMYDEIMKFIDSEVPVNQSTNQPVRKDPLGIR